jgi:hypothetical protein
MRPTTRDNLILAVLWAVASLTVLGVVWLHLEAIWKAIT